MLVLPDAIAKGENGGAQSRREPVGHPRVAGAIEDEGANHGSRPNVTRKPDPW